MGQYYIIYNVTRKVSVKPAKANWKSGEWSWAEVIELMGWSHDDEIVAIGDYGSVIPYSGHDDDSCGNDSEDDYDDSEDDSSNCLNGTEYVKKYINEQTGEVLDEPVVIYEPDE